MPWRDEERTQRSAISPRLGMDAPPPTVSDGRYPPRGYEPARRGPPSALAAFRVSDDPIDETFAFGHQGATGATTTMAPQMEQMRVRDRDAAFNARRNFPEPGSLNSPPRPPSATASAAPAAAPSSRLESFRRGGLKELWGREDRTPAQFPDSRFAAPRTPTPTTPTSATGRAVLPGDAYASGRARATSPLVDVPDLEAAAKRSATGRAGMGNIMPREYAPSTQFPGAHDSGVKGIGVRRGPSNELEFFDAGGFKDPIRRGENTVNYAPAGSLGNMTTPQATTDAVRAAAARGDWSALERSGRMAPRSGGAVGGAMGGAPRMEAPDQFAQAEQLRKQAQSLYQQAGRVRGGSNKSPLIREANMLSSMAESLIGAGATMSGQQAALDQEAMKQTATMQKALGGEAMTPADMADIRKTLSEAGLNDARSTEIMKKLTDPERGNLLPFDIGSEDMTALTTALGRDGFAEYLTNALKQEQVNSAMGILQSAGIPLAELIAAAEAGETLPPSIMQALGTVGVGKPMAMGGLVTNDYDEPMGYEDGGFVDDPMMLDPAMMDQGMPEMGAMDAMGMGMGEPQADPMQMEYEQYSQVAEQLGLPVIPFEQFAQIMQQAQQPETAPEAGAMSFARGGPVDASAKMVVDPDPAAATDSIPAMIDGQQPAKLDSGEFVIPRNAVLFHGIDKLNKLIAQADQNGSGPEQAQRG